MNATPQQVTVLRRGVVYPDSDGEPLGETDFHIGTILYLRCALRWLFRELQDVYVAANMLFYYEEGEPASVTSPDVFAVRGIAKHDRRCYKLWEERVAPCLAIEVTSRSSRIEDLGTKRGLFEMLGVSEYLVFDPLGEYLEPRFRAFALERGVYKQAALTPVGEYRSELLPVVFKPEGPFLRALDSRTGVAVPLFEESAEMAALALREAEDERHRAEDERHRAESLEAKLARYRERFGELGE
ncbi:MAG: Uma2 family endonuclease [Candidatus Riflebacteria bacterium]|nr:Uma2 family endonuclease [Candidatus Riflebacteria bacterium]